MAGKLTHPLPDHDYCLACSPVTSTVSPSSLHQMMVTTESEEVHSLAITSPENKLKFTATKGQEEPTMEPLAQTSKLDISIDLVPRTSETISSVPLVSPSKDALVPTTGANTSSQLLRKKYVLVSVSVSTIPVETGLAVWQVRRLNLKSESQVILSLGFT